VPKKFPNVTVKEANVDKNNSYILRNMEVSDIKNYFGAHRRKLFHTDRAYLLNQLK